MRGQVFRRIEQALEAFAADTRGRFAGAVACTDLLVPGSPVVCRDRLLDLCSAPRWRVSPVEEGSIQGIVDCSGS